MTHRIATLNKISPEGLALFGSDYEIGSDIKSPDALLVRSAQVDVEAWPSILAVARAGAGVNNITLDKATAAGVCVFNTPGANANAVAELVFIVLGAAARNLVPAMEYVRQVTPQTGDDKELDALVEKNKAQFSGFELAGKTLGVIGLGKIGVLVANAGIQHGMKVVAFDPFPTIENIHMLNPQVVVASNQSGVMKSADVLSVHVPLSDKTRGMINAQLLSEMRPGGILVNYARGGVVDDKAVVAALDSGALRMYLCDFPTKALVAHPKVVCTPHLGASTEESEENCATMAVNELRAYLEYGNVQNSVNFPIIESVPQQSTKSRLIVINKDIPNMIATITQILGKAGVNIVSYTNKSNGKVGYNIVDTEVAIPAELVATISASPDVIRTRVIEF